MIRIALLIVLLLAGLETARAEGLHVLKGRIVRSLSVDPGDAGHILVGQKAGAPGSALVFRSLDGGATWRTLNGNRPLAPEASDVQAVAALSKSVLLAGTWKHGLFVSRDGGRRFARVADFPSADVRDLEITDGVVHAATARHGVFESTDEGRSWRPLGPPGTDFLWSVTASGGRLLASSPEGAVFERAGGDWRRVFAGDGAYAAARAGERVAVAGETGLHLRAGESWRTRLAGEKLADVVFTGDGGLLVGSWSDGIALVGRDGLVRRRLLAGRAVIHVRVAGEQVLAGTWGDGLHILPRAAFGP